MLNIQCDGKKMRIQHRGQPQDLAVEMATALSGIYNALQTENEVAAEVFRMYFVTCVMPDSPIWEKDHGRVTIKVPIKKSDAHWQWSVSENALGKGMSWIAIIILSMRSEIV